MIHVDRIVVAADHEMIPVDLFPVDHDEHARVAVDDRIGGKALLDDVDVRPRQRVRDALVVAALDLCLADERDVGGDIGDLRIAAARRDNNIGEAVGFKISRFRLNGINVHRGGGKQMLLP